MRTQAYPLDQLFPIPGDACPSQHAAQVDDLVLFHIVMPPGIERLSLRAHGHSEPAIVLLRDGADALEERQDVVPLDVVARGVTEDLVHRRLMMRVELIAFCHFSLQTAPTGIGPCSACSASLARARVGFGVICHGCVEIPTALALKSPGGTTPRFPETIGIIDPSVQSNHALRVVEFRPGLLKFSFVYLERRVERRVLLELLNQARVEPRGVVDRLVSLFEGFRTQWLVG